MRANYYRQSAVEKAYRNGFTAGVRRALDDILAVVALQLQDKHRWTPEDIHVLEYEVNDQFDSICRGYIGFEDIERTKKEEIG